MFCGDAINTFGIDQLLNGLVWLAPSAAEKSDEIGLDPDGNMVELSVNEDGAPAAVVFKTIADPFVGKLSYFKVISGKVSPETPLVNMRTGNQERISKVMTVKGKKQEDAPISARVTSAPPPSCKILITGDTCALPCVRLPWMGWSTPILPLYGDLSQEKGRGG